MEETIIRQNPWWDKTFNPDSIKRNKYLTRIKDLALNKEIIFLTGLRRVGKTTLLYQTIEYLINEKNVNPKNILFLTLDNLNFTNKKIIEIIQKYREINEIKLNEFFYLFLDEITYVENFEQELKNLYDTWEIKIFASSSIASFLNDKKAFLTGRTYTIEIEPLDYEEFLLFKNVKISKYDKSLNKKYFEEYMQKGGIPQYVLTGDSQYITELVNSIIYKDIIAQYKIEDEKTIKELLRLLCQRIGKPTSYNKLSKILNISDITVKKYINYFEKTYLFYSIEKYSKSVNENITSPKKFYICDLGIKNIISDNKEKGPDYENLVYLKIRTNNPKYYIDNGIEIDFITKKEIIEAKYESELNTKQQELFEKIKIGKKIIAKDYNFFYQT